MVLTLVLAELKFISIVQVDLFVMMAILGYFDCQGDVLINWISAPLFAHYDQATGPIWLDS